MLDLALEEVRVRDSGLGLVVLGEREHLVGHVEPVDDARRPDAPRGEEDVDAATRAEVEHRVALAQLGDGRRIAAAEACRRCRAGERRPLVGVVQRLTPQRVLVRVCAARAAPATAGSGGGDGECRLGVACPDFLAECFCFRGHVLSSHR